jgi:hypothetical protein
LTTETQPAATYTTPDRTFQIAASFMAAKHLFEASDIDLSRNIRRCARLEQSKRRDLSYYVGYYARSRT